VKKRILALYYSQSGQTQRIAEAFLRPFQRGDGIELFCVALRPIKAFPFPWSVWKFFDAMPESVLMVGCPLDWDAPQVWQRYDLIIIFYQVWFLSPSPPVVSLVRSKGQLFQGTPVVTVVNARDKWVCAQRKMAELIDKAGGKLAGHVAVVPRVSPVTGLVTTLRWLWTGKREPFWWFPEAGLTQAEIDAVERFGVAVYEALSENRLETLGKSLENMKAAPVDIHLLRQEEIGERIFRRWAGWIRGKGDRGLRRDALLALFMIQLAALIMISLPISLVIWIGRCFRRLCHGQE